MHSAIKCLVLLARQNNVDLHVDSLLHDYHVHDDEADDHVLIKIASEHGFKARSLKHSLPALAEKADVLPAIIRLKNNSALLMTAINRDENGEITDVTLLDPTVAEPAPKKLKIATFNKVWTGNFLLITRQYQFFDLDRPFGTSWLVSAFMANKALMIQLVVIALLLNIFAVLPAVFIMIVLDKVVNFEATSTLYVITIGVIIAYIFNGFLGYLKQYIVYFVSGKVDARLNVRLFSKMMELPVTFFRSKSLTDLSKLMQQTITLRQIISGRLFNSVLDATALLIFVPILYFYSPLLCIIVLIFSFAMSINLIISGRSQQSKLAAAAGADSAKQAIMMDSFLGIDTVKSLALEPIQKRQWEHAVSQHTLAHMSVNSSGAISQQISSTLQQLMTVAVIFTGVQLVFSGDLSPGVLIAVNMLASKVTTPLTQLVSLAMDLDKLHRSIDSIGSIVNTRGEHRRTGVAPDLLGGLQFNNVSFKYPGSEHGLNAVSFTVQPRQSLAIIGSTGSCKSTITKLMQGMVRPSHGDVLADGQDIRLIDLSYFRYHIACVTESVHLFRGTVRENILLPLPGATTSRLNWVTDLVGLTKDLDRLSDGLETEVDEDGSSLSEDVRLKIALARALIRDPKILILDEILSRFDLENEQAMLNRLPQIAMGRTLILMASRTSHVRGFEKILVMDRGELIEQGNHQSLLEQNGHYRKLWQQEQKIAGIPTTTYQTQAQTQQTQAGQYE